MLAVCGERARLFLLSPFGEDFLQPQVSQRAQISISTLVQKSKTTKKSTSPPAAQSTNFEAHLPSPFPSLLSPSKPPPSLSSPLPLLHRCPVVLRNLPTGTPMLHLSEPVVSRRFPQLELLRSRRRLRAHLLLLLPSSQVLRTLLLLVLTPSALRRTLATRRKTRMEKNSLP